MSAAREDCERLQAFIDDLLVLARLQSGRLEMRKRAVGVQQLLEGSASEQRHTAIQSQVRLQIDRAGRPSAELMVDPERVLIVFGNLIPERLSACRQMRDLSQRQLGALSGTSDNFVQMTETGPTVPGIAKVEQLAKALPVSVSWLAFGLGSPDLPDPRRRRSDSPLAPAP